MGEPFIPREPEWLLKANAGIKTTSELPKVIPPLPEGDTKDLKVWKEYWEKHDEKVREKEREHWQTERAQLIATIDEKIAAAREGVLNKIKEYADTCIWVDDDCCPGKMNDKEYSDCDGCGYVDYPNNADICEKIESLRTKKE